MRCILSELSELEHLISVRIMQEDAEAIYSLLKTERESIVSMEIIPYYALFVQSNGLSDRLIRFSA